MQNRSKMDHFEPLYLRRANKKLERDILSASVYKKVNEHYKKDIFKSSLWGRFLALFKN